MSRSLSTAVSQALARRHLEEVIFVELEFKSGTVHLCSREHDVFWNGITWRGAGRVGTIEPLEEGVELEARSIAMTLSAIPAGILGTALDPSEYKNRPCKLWLGLLRSEHYLSLPGTSGNYASTPDSAAVSITGDITLVVKFAPDSWTGSLARNLIAKRAPGIRLYALDNRTLTLNWHEDESTQKAATSSASIPNSTDPIFVKATLEVDTGSGWRVRFYTSSDGDDWTQLGSDRTGTPATQIAENDRPLFIGQNVAASSGAEVWPGKVYYAEVRNGIDGPVVAKFDPQLMSAGQTSAQMPTGEVWTVNQSGSSPAKIVTPAAGIVADPIGPFLYRMDSLDFELGATGTVRLTAHSRLEDWQRPRIRRYNNEDQQALYPGDRFCEYAEKMVNAEFRW